ncbi:MAG: helix-turn-helix domain-containing protein [Actinomycetes bacterium]
MVINPAQEVHTGGEVPGPDDGFSAAIAALSSAFGDPTRRAIYIHLRTHPSSSVAELAAAFDLHPNVVRHHLDRLIAGSHVDVEAPQRTANVGRPAKRFSCANDDISLEMGSRRDDLLVALLERSLELLGPEQAELMAAAVGEEYGRKLAAKMGPSDAPRSVSSAMAAIAETLTAHGFAARTENTDETSSVVADSCPFGEAAAHHPVLCAVDRGMVTGLLQGLGAGNSTTSVHLSSRARGDDTCRATA